MKLLVAIDRLAKVIILRFNDTYEERICLLCLSMSNRVILREIIPLNLLQAEETLRVDMAAITEKEIVEAQQLIKSLPEATEETFSVSDYRTIGVETRIEAPKVRELKEILATVKAK